MARYDHLPIWKTAMDLAVLLERAVRGFPRYHKYALGADLRRQAQRICTLIVRANEARVERERALEQLVCAVEEMKTLIQLGKAIQAFTNFNELDQFIKHTLKARYYMRYVDDFVLLHEDPAQLEQWRDEIVAFLDERLGLRLRGDSIAAKTAPTGDGEFVGGALSPERAALLPLPAGMPLAGTAPIRLEPNIAAEAAPTGARPQAFRTKGEKPTRPGFAASVEIPAKALPRLRRKLKAAGIPHVAVAETGYLKSGHKRRELVYSWAPPGAFPSFHPVVR